METGFNSSCQSLFLVVQISLSKSCCICVFFSHMSVIFFSVYFLLVHIWIWYFTLLAHKKDHKIHPTDFSSLLSRAEPERERETGVRERERERGAQFESTFPFLSRPLSLSLSLQVGPLEITIVGGNHPPGSAWECSGIITSGTPSTITQRTHRLTEVGWKTVETRQWLAAMAHKHGHGRERVSRD